LQEKKRYFKFILIFLSAIILLIVPHQIAISSGETTITTAVDTIHPLIVSTRGHFDNMTGELLTEHNKTNYTASNIPGLQSGECQNEIAIIVHGWSLNEDKANERFVRANMSLAYNNYTSDNNSIVGFTWDANLNENNWNLAKFIAKDNGPKLAKFILDFKIKCPNTDVRLVAHSLGSRVVLSALDNLYNNQKWNKEKFKVTSVHLMGAAVDDEEVSKDLSYVIKNPAIVKNMSKWYDVFGIKSAYGKAIENVTSHFYNLFDPKDKALIKKYTIDENDTALGLKEKQEGITTPSNYNPKNVQDKILALYDADADNNPDFGLNASEPIEKGDNHAGYFGFIKKTDNKKVLIDPGAIKVVVDQWRNQR
jgi:Alpha/beta hydrolase of unknown function (DUF900)